MEELRFKLPSGHEVVIDAEDFPLFNKYTWYLCPHTNKSGRVRNYVRGRMKCNSKVRISLHRLILNPSTWEDVDHINGDCLDNRKLNLRTCNRIQNCQNSIRPPIERKTSLYKGVCWDKKNVNWLTRIYVNRKSVNLGRFINEIDAARAYNFAAQEYFGEFARVNQI